MNEVVRITLFAVVLLLIQIGLGPLLEVFRVRPDLILIYCLLVSLRYGRIAGLTTGFFLGLSLDMVSIGPIGIHALVKSSLAYWTGVWLDDRVGSVAIGWWIIILSTASLLQGVTIGLLSPEAAQGGLGFQLLRFAIPATIYTSIVGMLWAIAPMGARSRGPLAPATTRGRRSLR